MEKNCLICKKPFKCPKSHFARRKYCSRSCKAFLMKGKPFFDSTGIPSWNKGTKGLMNPWNKGKKNVISSNTRKLMSEARKKHSHEKHPRWKGGKRITRGYIMIFSPDHPYKNANNCVYEHRLVMEKFLDRYLLPCEVVHHINKNKLDNRIENLMIFNTNKDHMLFHAKNKDIKGRPKSSCTAL